MINVLIADDQELFCESLKIVLEALTDELRVIGVASDGSQAVQMAQQLQPDLILMDVRMPKMDGTAATNEILKANPQQKIIIITSFQEERYAAKTLMYGAIGYLLKNMQPANLISAIRAANEGMILLSARTAAQLFKPDNAPEESEELLLWYKEIYVSLNKREREILKLMIDGHSNKQIAQALYLSEPTVRNYISSIYCKFDISNRMEEIEHGKKIMEYFSDG